MKAVVQQDALVDKGVEYIRAVNGEEKILDAILETFVKVIDLGEVVEIKVLMEYCEGGSLESVGKRMREIGGRVSERVAGRLAEGVRIRSCSRRPFVHLLLSPTRF